MYFCEAESNLTVYLAQMPMHLFSKCYHELLK